ncbi:DUF4906 domain-containing protein [Parabacteroides segnis]|uniref:DUF4906 domain-containing protein n=1 Tax=Parabacteroides segnis TaxID=2763058 RepID=UPI003514E2A0
MAGIGHKLETKGVIMALLSLVLISTGCEDKIDPSAVNPSEGETVEVTLNLGIANEEDGVGTTASPTSKANGNSNKAAFEVLPVAKVQTKAEDGKPDQLYNLEIIQYNSTGTKLQSQMLSSAVTTGTTITVSLTAASNCKLLLIAHGNSNYFSGFSGKATLDAVRSATDILVEAKTSSINGIATDATGSALANMPYYLLLEDVNIINEEGRYKIQSTEGSDVRLLLKRLAAKVQLDWHFDQAMTNAGYTLKEVKLCQVPAHYRLIPETETTDKWGEVYPTSVAEFTDAYRLTGTELAKGTKTVWIPANARGISSYATSPIYRNKENANASATYAEFVVDNKNKEERLYYRAYLGGNETNDFNLLENKNYEWTVNINHANYTSDPRIQLLDQTPVKSTNEQPTSNCFMMKPGTNICFNPYEHEAGTDGWNTELTTAGAILTNKTIDKVEVLWQTKDAGTSGDLVMGYIVDNTNHQNLVNLTDGSDIKKARIHIKVPVTNGGNAVVAAKNSSGIIVWSWHLWISDYVPVGLSGDITTVSRNAAIQAAQKATQSGMVQVYGGISWTDPDGAFYKKVIMDRNLGATRAGIQNNLLDGVRTFGLLYQGGRKDPFFCSADGTAKEMKTIYDGDGKEVSIDKIRNSDVTAYDNTIQNPLTFYLVQSGSEEYTAFSKKPDAWGSNSGKTIYDPCPKGWRVPSNKGGGADAKQCMMAGFGSTNLSWVPENNSPASNNTLRFYDGTALKTFNTSSVASSTFVGSGFVYTEGSGETMVLDQISNKSAFFPGVSLREHNTGAYRDKEGSVAIKNNTVYIWASSMDNNSLYIYQFQSSKLYFKHTISRAFGFSVRCVQE